MTNFEIISKSKTYLDYVDFYHNLSGCILLVSDDNGILYDFARFFACSILCNSSPVCLKCNTCEKIITNNAIDVITYPKHSQNISVDDIKELIDNSIKSPFEFKKKIFILNNIDKASIAAQNKLLKTLEELNDSTVIIFTTSQKKDILPTILSRCNEFNLPKLSENEFIELLKEENSQNLDLHTIYDLCDAKLILGKNMLSDESVISINKVVINIFNTINANNIYKFSEKILEEKGNLRKYLNIMTSVLNKIIFDKISNNSTDNDIQKRYSLTDLLNISNLLALSNKKIKFNTNEASIVDNLLIKIMEARKNV